MEQALDAIQSRMDIMAIDGDAQAMELAADIETMIEQARRSITATFATNPNAGAGSAASQSPDSEGGSQEADSEEGGGE